jgi:hypothetical protein
MIVLLSAVCVCSALPVDSSVSKETVKTSDDLIPAATDYHSQYAPEVHSSKYGDEHDSYGKYMKDYGDQAHNHYGKWRVCRSYFGWRYPNRLRSNRRSFEKKKR